MGRALTSVVSLALVAACHGDDRPLPPTIVAAGPVMIDTRTLTITVGSNPPLELAGFLEIGRVAEVDATHYYDPRDAGEVTWHTPARAVAYVDGGWLELDDGSRILLGDGPDGTAVLDVDVRDAKAVLVRMSLPADPGEPLFGTGDDAVSAEVSGHVREMELRVDVDSESSLNETHVPVPLVLWPRRGAALLVADDRAGAIDAAAARADRVSATFTLPDRGAYRAHIWTAAPDRPLDLVRTYAAITGLPAVPPRWAFAPQQWRNEHHDRTEVLDDAAQMRALGLPATLMWIDNPWETGYNSFVIDETRFSDPDGMFATLAAQGYLVQVWSTPYVDTTGVTAADFRDAADRGFLVVDDVGNPITYPWQEGPGGLVDFTGDGATAWWQERIARIRAHGVVGFKLDFGEDLVPDLTGTIVPMHLAAGDNSILHRRYARHYHDAYLGTFAPGEGTLLTRAGAWGEQSSNPSIWPGDLDSDFTINGVDNGSGQRNVGGLPSAIARGLALSVSGYPFYGSDIGGFRGFPTTETLARWIEYASLGTIMQLGGGGKSHNPWDATLFGPAALPIYRSYARLHMDLNPLLWTLALRAGIDGTPVTRPASFVYDCTCDDATFLLGDDLVVAPVIEPGATSRTVVLPPGAWVDWWTGATVASDGHTAITVAAPLDRLPLWQRAGAIVPMFARAADTLAPATAPGVTSYLDPAYGSELRLRYTPGDTTTAATSLHDGASAAIDSAQAVVRPGSEYSVFTLDIDLRGVTGSPWEAPATVEANGQALPSAADRPALAQCPAPGCSLWDNATRTLLIRVHATAATTIVVR